MLDYPFGTVGKREDDRVSSGEIDLGDEALKIMKALFQINHQKFKR